MFIMDIIYCTLWHKELQPSYDYITPLADTIERLFFYYTHYEYFFVNAIISFLKLIDPSHYLIA